MTNYAFITGTGKGIGKAIAEALLATNHWKVVGISRSQSIEHDSYSHKTLDLSDREALEHFRFPSLLGASKVVLINNAGILGEVKHIGNCSDDSFIDGFTVNLIAPAVLMNKFIGAYDEMKAQKLIINVTSGAATSAYDGWGMYSPSKAGLDMLTKVADMEQHVRRLAYPFRIMAVAPGVVNTNMQNEIRSSGVEGFSRKDKFIELHTSGALYNANDVAHAYLDIIDHPERYDGVIHRVQLA